MDTNLMNTPKSWLVESILAIFLCCLLFGIIGIIYATKIESKFYRGNIKGSFKHSKTAEKWVITSVISGLLLIFLYSAIATIARNNRYLY